ncbi:MAG: hypothetical protein IK130_00885 [Oscillospiraceae bacterium]|nr:hypothetical protein [Oscillospiraceae bacterium]
MKIALSRSKPSFWMLYFAVHFSFLMIVLFIVRWLWALINHNDYMFDLAEMAFESAVYALLITVFKIIRYIIGKKRYEKNPQDRRRNNLFRE